MALMALIDKARVLELAREQGHVPLASQVFSSMLGAHRWLSEHGGKSATVLRLGVSAFIVVA
jgi:hypothetical protein